MDVKAINDYNKKTRNIAKKMFVKYRCDYQKQKDAKKNIYIRVYDYLLWIVNVIIYYILRKKND